MSATGAGYTGHVVDADSFGAATGVSRETLQRLRAYEACLRRWQKTINLVSGATIRDVWSRHFLDSARLLPHIPEGARTLVDMGSGAGFPGLVLSVMLAGRLVDPPCAIHLIESDRRKCVFLAEVLRTVGVEGYVHRARIEDITARNLIPSVDVVTARACAPLPRLLDLAAPFFGPQTTGLFLKGKRVSDELTAARKCWRFTLEQAPGLTNSNGVILKVRELIRGNQQE